MISTKSLIRGLILCMSLDAVLTIIGAWYMGATELNIFSDILGFGGFMAFKLIASVGGAYIIYKYCIPSAPMVARYGTVMLLAAYGMVCASNANHLIAAVV